MFYAIQVKFWSCLVFLLLLGVPALALEPEASKRRILELCNRVRKRAGLRPLSLDLRLARAALQHSQEMDRLHYFAHLSPLPRFATLEKRLLLVDYYGLTNGENLYLEQGYPLDGFAERALESWMASPKHRQNLLEAAYNRMGLGITCVDDQYTVTQVFGYTAVEVLGQQVQREGSGYRLNLRCRVIDGPCNGAVFDQGRRLATWVADSRGFFRVKAHLPGPGTVALGEAVGEREWAIESEWPVGPSSLNPGSSAATPRRAFDKGPMLLASGYLCVRPPRAGRRKSRPLFTVFSWPLSMLSKRQTESGPQDDDDCLELNSESTLRASPGRWSQG